MKQVIVSLQTIVVGISLSSLGGCGMGLCVANPAGECTAGLSETVPRLVLSGLLTVRKNDCYPIVLGAVDAEGAPITNLNTSVTITHSSSVSVYSSLQGCQKYDSADVKTAYQLTSAAPQVTFYIRTESEDPISLDAQSTNATSSLVLADGSLTSPVTFTAFDGAIGPNKSLSAATYDPSLDKTYVGGAETFDDVYVGNIVRLDNTGKLDTTFLLEGTGLNFGPSVMVIDTAGRLIIGGSFSTYNGTSVPNILRFNSNGKRDTSFAVTGTGFDSMVRDIDLQADGKLVVSGSFTSYNGTSAPYLARLNTDGTLDTTFAQSGTGFANTVTASGIQSDGKIVAGGFFTTYNATARARVARLNSDGSLDTTFVETGTGLNAPVYHLALQPDNAAIVTGGFTQYNGANRNNIARLNTDGSLDNTFVPTGTGFNGATKSFLDSNGKALVIGNFTQYNGTTRNYLARLNTDGSLDTGFAPASSGFIQSGILWPNDLVLHPGNQPMVVGSFGAYDGVARKHLLRLNSNGTLDSTYGESAGNGFNSTVRVLQSLSDGKILASGAFSNHSGTSRNYLLRLKADGTLDSSFDIGTGFGAWVLTLGVQTDGKVLAGGQFFTVQGNTKLYIARLNTDGSLDSTFATTGAGLNGEVWTLSLQSDDKAIIGGTFMNYHVTSRNYIARLNTDGSLDASFTPGIGFNSAVVRTILQGDGKVLVGGTFTQFNGTARPYLARLNTNGTLDTTFAQTGTGLNATVNSLTLQSDGKILVGGSFTSYNGTAAPCFARLNGDGSLDTSFAMTGTGLGGTSPYVLGSALDADGKILVTGNFSNYNGTTRNNIVRLNSDGTLDSTFAPGSTGLNSYGFAIIPLADSWKYLVGGDFSAYGPSSVNYFCRLTYSGALD